MQYELLVNSKGVRCESESVVGFACCFYPDYHGLSWERWNTIIGSRSPKYFMGEERNKEEFWQNVPKELLAGMIIELSAELVLALVVDIFYHNLVLVASISFSLLVTLSLFTLLGAVISFLINRLKIDPVIASGSFVTTINDAMRLLFYFSVQQNMLHVL